MIFKQSKSHSNLHPSFYNYFLAKYGVLTNLNFNVFTHISYNFWARQTYFTSFLCSERVKYMHSLTQSSYGFWATGQNTSRIVFRTDFSSFEIIRIPPINCNSELVPSYLCVPTLKAEQIIFPLFSHHYRNDQKCHLSCGVYILSI